jgi:TonB family protein
MTHQLQFVRRPIGRGFVSVFAGLALCASFAFAEEPPCKPRNGDVKVAYPELARRMKIAGSVRLLLDIDKNGGVHSAKPLGGNPVLISAAQDAVKGAKFENAEPCVISFSFKE